LWNIIAYSIVSLITYYCYTIAILTSSEKLLMEKQRMSKKLLSSIIISIILCSAVFIEQVSSNTIAEPTNLKIYVGPPSVPADNSTYNCLFVQLQVSSGNPARALQDTTISLSSSLTNIGTVDSSIMISSGSTYGTANFHSTFTPGITTITAAATGYTTVQESVTTVGPKPSAIAVYGFPSTLPADGNSYDAIMVQLQDSSGSPAKAPKGGIQVALSCSNVVAGDVTPSVTILEGQTYAIATFTTTSTAGQAVITPVALDFTIVQGTGTITTKTPTTPYQLKISTGPTKVLADNNAYRQIAIQLQDSAGNLATASSDVTVTIASSDKSIGTTETQITIPQSKTYALATFTTTYKAGTTTIYAAATGLVAANQPITTSGFNPSKLAVYCVPATLPSDNTQYQTIQVQLQDEQGNPAKDPEAAVTVNLFSSEPTIGKVSSTLTIPFGKTHATGGVTVTNAPGSTVVTAQASSYTPGQATLTTYAIDFSRLHVTVTANPENVLNGNNTEITAYITADGNPITGATVTFASNNGGTFTNTQAGEAGYYTTTFTAPSFSKTTTCTITANGSKTGFIDSQGTAQIAVGPTLIATSSNSTGTLQLRVLDSSGNCLSDVSVSSTVQPAGAQILAGSTNETGYVTFKNVTAGSYTFEITKAGYETLDKTIDFKGNPLAMVLTLYAGAAQGDNTLIIIVAVVIVVVVIALISIVLIKRRKPAKPVDHLAWPMKS
jgi:hypothetical protein